MQIKLEQANNLYLDEVQSSLDDIDKAGIKYEVADAPFSLVQNDMATLVVKIAKDDAKAALAFGKLASDCNADEFDSYFYEGAYFIRIWWD